MHISIKPYSLILWCIALMHITWGVALWFVPHAVYITPLFPIYSLCVHNFFLTSFVLVAASCLSIRLLTYASVAQWHALLGALQQLLVLVTAGGAVYFASVGHYADNTPMQGWFILLDQFPSIIFAIGHFLGLLYFHRARAIFCTIGHLSGVAPNPGHPGGYCPYAERIVAGTITPPAAPSCEIGALNVTPKPSES